MHFVYVLTVVFKMLCFCSQSRYRESRGIPRGISKSTDFDLVLSCIGQAKTHFKKGFSKTLGNPLGTPLDSL